MESNGQPGLGEDRLGAHHRPVARFQDALGDGGVGLPALSEGRESRRRCVGQRIGPSPGGASGLGCQDDTDHQGQ